MEESDKNDPAQGTAAKEVNEGEAPNDEMNRRQHRPKSNDDEEDSEEEPDEILHHNGLQGQEPRPPSYRKKTVQEMRPRQKERDPRCPLKITGILLIVLGSVVLAGFKHQGSIEEIQSVQTSSIILIVVGVIVFVIAFLGCFGAIRESYGLLMAFAVFLLIIFIIELAIGIAVAVNKDQIKRETIRNIFNSQEAANKENWEMIQATFKCCGVDGYGDWNGQYPKSCCTADLVDGVSKRDEIQHCRTHSASTEYLFQRGCYDVLKEAYVSGKNILIGVGIGIALVEIVGIVLACWLAVVVKREKSNYE